MKRKIFATILFLSAFSFTPTFAGWYDCYNFKGTVGSYPITLSIQIKEGYFGGTSKKEFNIHGVYVYDRYNEPIKLEGKIDLKSQKVLLYENHDSKKTATFEFFLTENISTGTWTNPKTKSFPLRLNLVSKLNDTSKENSFNKIEILQSNTLSAYYFVGVYSKKSGDRSSKMDSLKIINKKNKQVFQVLDFSKIETETGNVITIIYENIEVANPQQKTLRIWNNVGRMGGYLKAIYNPKTNKFKLNPKPTIDGPN